LGIDSTLSTPSGVSDARGAGCSGGREALVERQLALHDLIEKVVLPLFVLTCHHEESTEHSVIRSLMMKKPLSS